MRLNENTSDCELVEKLRKGDIEAFDAVFEKYGARLFGFVLKYLKSKEETEGLVQDVFLKIWENRTKLKTETSLKSYLFTISYHKICRFFRKKQLNEKFSKEFGVEISIDPQEQVDYQSTLEQIEQLIAQLPPRQKLIFNKSRKVGKSARKIAAELKIAPGTVDNNISAALKFLRKHILGDNLALLFLMAVIL